MQNAKDIADSSQRKIIKWVKTHVNFFYRGMLAISILGMAFFLFSRQILGDDSSIEDGGVGAKTMTQIASGNVTIASRSINPKTGYGEILFVVNQPTDDPDAKFETLATDVTHKQKIKSKLERVTDEYYVLHLFNVPVNWKQIGISYGVVTASSPLLNFDYEAAASSQEVPDAKTSKQVSQAVYMMDYRRVKANENLVQSRHQTYVERYVAMEISDTKKAITSVKDDIKQADKLMVKYQAHVKDLHVQLDTATPYDMTRIQSSIDDTQKKITGLEATKKNGAKAIKLYQETLKKLYLQKQNGK